MPQPHSAPSYQDRVDAGGQLGGVLLALLGDDSEVLVMAVSRGGLPVGREVARILRAPLDMLVVRKLRVPGRSELVMGAIAEDVPPVFNDAMLGDMSLDARALLREVYAQRWEIRRQESVYRHGKPSLDLHGRTVVVVDDGFSTGFTMRAALRAVRSRGPAHLIAASPVGAMAACEDILGEADTLVCPILPELFDGVGQWYRNFAAVTHEEALACLEWASPSMHTATP